MSQARILEWVAVSFSRGPSRPRDRTLVSCTAGGFFTNSAARDTHHHLYSQASHVLLLPAAGLLQWLSAETRSHVEPGRAGGNTSGGILNQWEIRTHGQRHLPLVLWWKILEGGRRGLHTYSFVNPSGVSSCCPQQPA